MEAWAKPFYLSQEWRLVRKNYMKKVGGLCERCLKRGLITPAVVVHHRVHLTPENIKDEAIRVGEDNLEALCWSCHEKEHKKRDRRYTIDSDGHVIIERGT